jgi:hypothetical protein
MKPPKLQRWIDLLAAHLRHPFPVSFEQLIREVPASGSDQSARVRELGDPLLAEHLDSAM